MSAITAKDIIFKFPNLVEHLFGDLNKPISGPASSDSQNEGNLVFAGNKKSLKEINPSLCRTYIVVSESADWAKENLKNSTVLTTSNLMLAIALVNQAFFAITTNKKLFG